MSIAVDYYYFPWSHWSRVASLVLAEKGLFENARKHLVDIRHNHNFAPEYLALNPKGVVPTVVIDGEPVCNTPRIVRALDRLVPDPPAHPDEPLVDQWAARLEALKLMHLSYQVWTRGQRGERSADILDDKVTRARRLAREQPELAELYTRKADFFEVFRDEVYDPDHREATRAETLQTLDEMAARVEQTRFLCGDRWTWPDALATSILWRLEDLESGLAPWVGNPSHPLGAYYDRLKARPSFPAVFHDDPMIARL